MLDFLFGQKVVRKTTIKEKTVQTSKRVYNEEELKLAFEAGRERIPHPDWDFVYEDFEKYFEQFKK